MTLLAEPETIVREKTQTGSGSVAHIVVRRPDDATAQAYVLEARILGTPITALCGYVWVPHKNPSSLPVCEACKTLFEDYTEQINSTSGKELPYV